MAPQRPTISTQTMGERMERLRAFLCVLATQREFYSLSFASLNFWFGLRPRQIKKRLCHSLKDMTYHLFYEDDRIHLISFGPKRSVTSADMLATVRNFPERLCAFLDRKDARVGEFTRFTELIAILPDFEILWSLGDNRLNRLASFLDFVGLHATCNNLSQEAKKKGLRVERPVWGQIRLGDVDGKYGGPKTYTRAEASEVSLLKELYAQSLRLALRPLTRFWVFLVSLFSTMRLWLWSWRGGFRTADLAFSDKEETAVDDKHWQWSARLLASYWYHAGLSRDMTGRLLLAASFGSNKTALARALDMYFYCQAHCSHDRVMTLLSKIVSNIIRQHFPFLYVDTLMHQAILNYYLGNIRTSIKLNALVEHLLCDGHHPFNRLTNLSTSLRTSLVMKSPRLTSGLFRKLKEIPAFQTGITAARIELCAIIQWVREEGATHRYQSNCASIERLTETLAPLPRATIELLFSVFRMESGDQALALIWLVRAKESLQRAGLSYSYRRVLGLLDTIIDRWDGHFSILNIRAWWHARWAGVVWLRRISDLSGLSNEEWRSLSFHFGQLGLMDSAEIHLIDISEPIRQVETMEKLRNSMFKLMERWLPEFRCQISLGETVWSNEPGLPETLMPITQQERAEDKDWMIRTGVSSSTGGVEWVYLLGSAKLDNLWYRVVIAAPRMEKTHTSLRFSLAYNLTQMCCQSAARIFWGKKAAERARYSAIAEVARMVAHDIRSPLAALNVVERDLTELPEDKRIIMRSAVSRINDIANELFSRYRKTEHGDTNMTEPAAKKDSHNNAARETILLTSLVDFLVTEKRLQYRTRIGVEIDWQSEQSSYGLFVDVQAAKLKRALSNIINNAVEAIDRVGKVTVRVLGNQNTVEVIIEDNGKGIPDNVLSKIGKRGGTYDKLGGSGLGLFYARSAAQSWGGNLKLESAVKKGTIVRFSLPRAQPPSWFVSELSFSANSPVVVLDDDSSIHQVWKGRFEIANFESAGIEVSHFSTPDQLRSWVMDNQAGISSTIFLLDNELLGFKETGLSLIESLDISGQSILVTSHFEEGSILESCKRQKVKLIPKGMAGLVPIRVKAISEHSNLLQSETY